MYPSVMTHCKPLKILIDLQSTEMKLEEEKKRYIVQECRRASKYHERCPGGFLQAMKTMKISKNLTKNNQQKR